MTIFTGDVPTARLDHDHAAPLGWWCMPSAAARRGYGGSVECGLQILLKDRVHHFEALIADTRQQAGWTALRDRRNSTLLRELVAGHAAAVDVPAALHYEALMREYPHGKVVLTLHPRGARAWYAHELAA